MSALTDVDAERQNSALFFDTRTSCIACSSENFSTVWSASYNDSSVQSYMDSYGYATNWRDELKDQPISLVQCLSLIHI